MRTRSLIRCSYVVLLVSLLLLVQLAQSPRAGKYSSSHPSVVSAQGGSEMLYLPLVGKAFPQLPLFGVCMTTPVNASGGLDQAIAAGTHWISYGPFDWPTIEPVRTNPPTYHWELVDEQSLINAAQNDLTLVAKVHHTPTWAREIPSHNCSRIRQDYLDEFAQFLTALVNRYKAPPYNVRYWELDGEVDVAPSQVAPNDPAGFWCWGDTSDPYYGGAYYAQMLKLAYPAIKAADPAAQVLMGGLLLGCDPNNPPPGANCASSRFLEGVLRGGGGAYFDYVSFHAYSYYQGTIGVIGNINWTGGVFKQTTAIPEKTAFLRQVLNTYGYGDKGLMNTESALMCINGVFDCFQTQAMYIPRAFAEAKALNLTGQVWYQMKDPDWRYTGLLYEDLSPKPAYYAYQAAIAELSTVDYVGPISGYSSGVEGYTFRRHGDVGYLDVIWTPGQQIVVILPSGASVYNHFGQLISNAGFIELNSSPVYVHRP